MSDTKGEIRGRPSGGTIAVSREFSVELPKGEGGFLVLRSDWNRIKTMIARIVPAKNWYQVCGSICVGLAVSAIFSLIGFASSKDVPSWAKLTDWCVLVSGIVLSIGLFALDAQQRSYTIQRTADVTEEMDRIEKLCEATDNRQLAAGELAILFAEYGAGIVWVDVQPVLRSKIKDGKLGITVSNAELGCDPVPNFPKSLRLSYVWNGEQYGRTIAEGERLSLPV